MNELPGSPGLPDARQGDLLLRVARSHLLIHYGLQAAAPSDEGIESPCLFGGVFATLELGGELRGCVGYVVPRVDLLTATKRAVVAAACDDPRFGSVSVEEVPNLRISITVLAPPVPLYDLDQIEIGRDGLIVERGTERGLLLPQVAVRWGWDRERFLAETCRKAGLPLESWRERTTTVLRFEAVHFEEVARDVRDPLSGP